MHKYGRSHVSIYRVHFKWKDKDVELEASSLDLTHPYFVSIKGLIFPAKESLIIDPNKDEVRKSFGGADHIMIPFQTVTLIEEMIEDKRKKVMPFSVVDGEDQTTE